MYYEQLFKLRNLENKSNLFIYIVFNSSYT